MSLDQYRSVVIGPRPFEVLVLIAALLIGVGGLLSGDLRQASSSSALLSPNWAVVWSSGLILAAGISLAGLVMRNTVLSLLVERIGMALLATTFGGYGTAILLMGEIAFIRSGVIYLAIAITAVVRIVQITRTIRKLHQLLRTLNNGAPG